MVKLDMILPVSLMLNSKGKKVPIGGMKASNRVPYEPGMKNFAIYLEDYPDIVVLDLDTRDHELIKYTNETYTHKTRKGWHCFFKNTFNITSKRQKQAEKFDLLAGKNWCFYDYNDPAVAQYTEHNQLPLADMPSELYDKVKHTAAELGENSVTRFIPYPLIDILKGKKANLWDNRTSKWLVDNSSDLAFAVVMTIIPYTDVPTHIIQVLELIPEIDPKHSKPDYIERIIFNCKAKLCLTKALSWRPLSDFRACSLGGKLIYADIDNNSLVPASYVEFCTIPHIDVSKLHEFVETYRNVEFNPKLTKKFNLNTYNTFNGFIIPEQGKGHEGFVEYVHEVICNSNSAHSEYILNYLAHMVQKPYEKPDIAIVLYGDAKGTGKDTFHELVGQVFNDGGYIQLTEESLQGRFNKPLEACILGVAEELVFGGSHKEDSSLKRTITTNTRPIERKGFEAYEVRNYIRLVITSNEPRPVRATPGERRYFVSSPSTIKKGNFDYWDKLRGDFNPAHLLAYLQQRDIAKFNTRDLPDSKFLGEVIDQNKDAVIEALEYWWDTVYDGDFIDTHDLYDRLVADKKYMTHRQFSRKMMVMVGKHRMHKATKDSKAGYRVQHYRERGEELSKDD